VSSAWIHVPKTHCSDILKPAQEPRVQALPLSSASSDTMSTSGISCDRGLYTKTISKRCKPEQGSAHRVGPVCSAVSLCAWVSVSAPICTVRPHTPFLFSSWFRRKLLGGVWVLGIPQLPLSPPPQDTCRHRARGGGRESCFSDPSSCTPQTPGPARSWGQRRQVVEEEEVGVQLGHPVVTPGSQPVRPFGWLKSHRGPQELVARLGAHFTETQAPSGE
jgi:hypothetical protein